MHTPIALYGVSVHCQFLGLRSLTTSVILLLIIQIHDIFYALRLYTYYLTFSTYFSTMNLNNPEAAARAAWLAQFPVTRTTRSKSWIWRSIVWNGLLALFVGIAILLWQPSPSNSTDIPTDIPWSQQGLCHHILVPASYIKRFPLPKAINVVAHKLVLNKIVWLEPDKQLSSLANGRSLVCSQIRASVPLIYDFVKQLAYTCSESKSTNVPFNDTVEATYQQFEKTLTEIDGLTDLYAKMKDDYNTLGSSAEEALRKCRLGFIKNRLIAGQPQYLSYFFSIDFYKMWWLPLKDKCRKSEEVRLGVIALKRASRRLDQIGLIFLELKRSVNLLRGPVNQWVTELNGDGIPRQEQLQKWFHKSIHQNTKLGKLWLELFELIEDGEEQLSIDIKPDWCKQ